MRKQLCKNCSHHLKEQEIEICFARSVTIPNQITNNEKIVKPFYCKEKPEDCRMYSSKMLGRLPLIILGSIIVISAIVFIRIV